jgi:hypothetical protein
MDCPIPNDLLQGLCGEAKERFVAETGLTGKVAVELRLPDAPSPQFEVVAVVTDKTSGESRQYEIEVTCHSVH